MIQDSTSSLMKSIKHFFSGTLASRFTGLFRDVAMAYAFGTQSTVAAFLMAFRFAHLLRRLFGEGAMQSAFIPLFEKLKQTTQERASRFFVDMTATLTLCLLGFIVLSMACCAFFIEFDFISESNKDILKYTLIMLPSLLFICLFGLNAALLQCNGYYFLSSFAPVLFNIVWIFGAVFLANLPIIQAMSWLSACIILACAAQWCMTLPKTLKIIKQLNPNALRSKITFFSPDVLLLARPLFLAIIGVSAAQVNNALDVIFARYANEEGPAYLWYAIRLQQLPLALFGIAISSALLPPLTRALKNQDLARFKNFLSFALRRSVALMLPITAGIFLLGQPSIQLLYGHGDFLKESIEGTTLCLWGYGIGLIPMTLVLILAPALYAQENFRLPTQASIASMVVNIGLNAWFVMGLSWDAASVALATSLSAFVNVFILSYGLKEHLSSILTTNFIKSLMKIGIATCAGTLGLLASSPLLPYSSTVSAFTHVIVETGIFSVCFFTCAFFTNADDVFLWRDPPSNPMFFNS